MHLFISLVGLQFYLFKLEGTLTYEHTKTGKPPKQGAISETDIEDASDCEGDEMDSLHPLRSGLDASAVGLQLRLTKNAGLLHMKFEGRDGNKAEWIFQDLQPTGIGGIVASVGTQTYVNPDKCITCGHEKANRKTTQDFASQTNVVTIQGITFSAEAVTQTAKQMESEVIESITTMQPASGTTHANMRDASCQTERTKKVSKGLKRKTTIPPPADAPLHKRAKSKHDSEPWPRQIYMDCHRLYPISKSELGRLVIDIVEGTVWYEDTYGKNHARVVERKQIDLSKTSTRVTYEPNTTLPANGATHVLTIERLKLTNEYHQLMTVHCTAPKWNTWSHSAGDTHNKMYTTDAEVVVDAIVHCIDRTSGREAVHDPDAEYRMRDAVRREPSVVQQLVIQGAEKENYKVYRPQGIGQELLIQELLI